ncbi:MAG: MBL fold metallo-hydrolase [Gemmatimonadetes bacterium]|nr:MBL fold metallo-hydrolase [Gemmatimonadota bacterium]
MARRCEIGVSALSLMIVRFWGVRGSIAVPGAATLRYGGNTACVSIEIGNRMLILDAGTGIRVLGQQLAGTEQHLSVLISHAHADHIAGFAFFAPLYEPGRRIDVIDFEEAGRAWSLLELFDGLHSPVLRVQAAAASRRPGGADLKALRDIGFDVRTIPLNHPGGAWGFRITDDGRSFVYMTDNEIDAGDARTSFAGFADFCRGADVLCHDAQFLEEEMPARVRWGHTSVERACDLAIAAGVRRLVLFHHDPDRTDTALDRIAQTAAQRTTPHGTRCDVAWEGLCIQL